MTKLLAIVCVTLITVQVLAAPNTPIKFDEYGAINCEAEWARLDNYLDAVRAAKTAQAVIIVYGGRRDTRRDEVRARISFIKHYLTVTRSIERRRMIIYNGGFRERFTTQLWIIPAGVDAKVLKDPTVMGKNVRFKKGRTGNRIRNCSFIG